MSFRGRGGGRGGFSRGGGGGFGRGGFAPQGPPATVLEMGKFLHACEGEMVCESINPKIPYFNAPIYLENKTQIGKVDEILGPLNQVYFTVKPQEGMQAASFRAGDRVYIGGDKLLPLEKFLPKPKPLPGAPKVKKPSAGGRGGFSRGGMRGGRGGSMRGAPRGRGGFAPSRGGRGGFSSRGGSFGGGSSFGGRGGAPRGRGRGFSRG
ncbi:hypothetical protein ANO11243_012590 [Dothideomycetidae sp. 11243]|nr:hypothetical protein ANO11243_012590 [fungal sp. No.11243]